MAIVHRIDLWIMDCERTRLFAYLFQELMNAHIWMISIANRYPTLNITFKKISTVDRLSRR